MKAELRELLRHPGIWRSSESQGGHREFVPTGYPDFDQRLPGGGWPLGALTEILHQGQGIGELQVVMPALAHLSRQGRWLVWISPPHIPYAPALADHGVSLSRVVVVEARSRAQSSWAAEQALRAHGAGAVLSWPSPCDDRALRRLQLAAEAGGSWGVVFRPDHGAMQSSPAILRLRLTSSVDGFGLQVLKCRGGMGDRGRIEIPARACGTEGER